MKKKTDKTSKLWDFSFFYLFFVKKENIKKEQNE